MFIAVLGEIPAMITSYYIIDVKNLGRKNTMVLFFLISAVSNFFFYTNLMFKLSLFVSRFSFRIVSSMIYAYTTEVYKTSHRIIGVGWSSSMGRIGSLIMPFVVFPLFY